MIPRGSTTSCIRGACKPGPVSIRPDRTPRRSHFRQTCRSAPLTQKAENNGVGTAPEEASDSAPKLRRMGDWPEKTSLYLLRTDGKSCSRELVTGSGKLHFAYPSTQQHLIVWRRRPASVMVLVKIGNELIQEMLKVLRFLGNQGLRVVVEPLVYNDYVAHDVELSLYTYTFAAEETNRLAECVDFVICLGGDGVILHASALFKHNTPPIIAFNLGSLGFLTNFSFADVEADLTRVIHGSSRLDTCAQSLDEDQANESMGIMVNLRMRLRCEVVRRGSNVAHEVYEVLNEVVVDRGSSPFLSNIEVYEKGRYIARAQADGIMLATPTGSTAYSVAAGGSMMHPNVPAILLTPICPHSLSFRPIILPDYADIELRIPDNARCSAWVSFDGRHRQELNIGDRMHVTMSANPMPTINKTDLTGDWFDSLERCFGWSNRQEQRPLKPEGQQAPGA